MAVKFLKFKEALLPIFLDKLDKGSFFDIAFNDCNEDIVDVTDVSSFQDASYETVMAVINHAESGIIRSLPFDQLSTFLILLQLVHYIPNTTLKTPVCRKSEHHYFEILKKFLIDSFQRFLNNYSFESSKHLHCLPTIFETMQKFSMKLYINSILSNMNVFGNYHCSVKNNFGGITLYTLDILNLWCDSKYANFFKHELISFQPETLIRMQTFFRNDVNKHKIIIPDTFLFSIHLIRKIEFDYYIKHYSYYWPHVVKKTIETTTINFNDFNETFTERIFHFFDSPLIKTYLNEKKIVIAGGFIGACLIKQNVAPDSDVDIFVFDKTILQNLLMEIESFAHSKQKHCYFLRKPMLSCIDVYIEDIPLVYSFVIVPKFVCTYQLLISFDMAHCQLAYNGSEVLGTIDGLMAWKSKVSYYNDKARFNNYKFYEQNIHPAKRVALKCLSRGFNCIVRRNIQAIFDGKRYNNYIEQKNHKPFFFKYATSFFSSEQNVKQICLNFNENYPGINLENNIKLNAQEAFVFFTKFDEEKNNETYKPLQEWIVEQKIIEGYVESPDTLD